MGETCYFQTKWFQNFIVKGPERLPTHWVIAFDASLKQVIRSESVTSPPKQSSADGEIRTSPLQLLLINMMELRE